MKVQRNAPPFLFLHRDQLFDQGLDALEGFGALELEPPFLGDIDNRREQSRDPSAALHAARQAEQFSRRVPSRDLDRPCGTERMLPAAGEEHAEPAAMRGMNRRRDRQPFGEAAIEPEQRRAGDVDIGDEPAPAERDEADRREVIQIGVP